MGSQESPGGGLEGSGDGLGTESDKQQPNIESVHLLGQIVTQLSFYSSGFLIFPAVGMGAKHASASQSHNLGILSVSLSLWVLHFLDSEQSMENRTGWQAQHRPIV